MVTEFGMSEKLGPLAFGKRDELVFLGREIGEQRNYSDEVAKQIDEEVRAIIDRAYERAIEVLTTHKDKLVALAEKLVAEETVDSEEFEKMFMDLPPKQDLHGTPVIVGPAQPIPEPNPRRPDRRSSPARPTRAGRQRPARSIPGRFLVHAGSRRGSRVLRGVAAGMPPPSRSAPIVRAVTRDGRRLSPWRGQMTCCSSAQVRCSSRRAGCGAGRCASAPDKDDPASVRDSTCGKGAQDRARVVVGTAAEQGMAASTHMRRLFAVSETTRITMAMPLSRHLSVTRRASAWASVTRDSTRLLRSLASVVGDSSIPGTKVASPADRHLRADDGGRATEPRLGTQRSCDTWARVAEWVASWKGTH